MPDQPLVSVVIPFCNAVRFCAEAVESVLSQTYTCWELILVDDGSRDGTSKIAQDHAEGSNGKIRYVEHEGHRNLGVTRSRNFGARSSCGELLAFLDADDVWLPQKLDYLVSIMAAYPEAGLVFGPSEYWYD
jgi:glycosyltransferase involved in cell wall biosynthesis